MLDGSEISFCVYTAIAIYRELIASLSSTALQITAEATAAEAITSQVTTALTTTALITTVLTSTSFINNLPLQ